MQPATVPIGSGRRRQACPPGAPNQTSGSVAIVSPPGPGSASVVRMTSSSPRAKRSLSGVDCAVCRRTLSCGCDRAKPAITRGTCGFKRSSGEPRWISPTGDASVIRLHVSSFAARSRRAWSTSCSPCAVSVTPRPVRSKSGRPKASSSRLICSDTADWVRLSWPAARVTPPVSATVMNERNAAMSRLRAIPDLERSVGTVAGTFGRAQQTNRIGF